MHVGDSMVGLGYSNYVRIILPSLITATTVVVHGVMKPWWQTGLALNGGDSGAPIFGPEGTVVGIATSAAYSNDAQSFVIPVQYASELIAMAGAKVVPKGPCAP